MQRFLSKIAVWDIIRDHYGTLRDFETDKPMLGDWVLFLGVPGAVAAVIVATDTELSDLGTLLTAISIVAGLLFALLILVLEVAINTAERVEADGNTVRRRRRVEILRELKANVAYAVLVSVLAAVVLAVGDITGPSTADPAQPGGAPAVETFPIWYTALVGFLLTHFALTLVMVLKRMYRLLDRELVAVEAERVEHPQRNAS